MSLRQRLQQAADELPERTVTLAPVAEGAEPDVVTVRALPADVWDLLVRDHPPTKEQVDEGWQWNTATFRPALLAACVVSPADEGEPLTEQEWAALLVKLPFGDRDRLFAAAFDVNDNRWPGDDLGKDSR